MWPYFLTHGVSHRSFVDLHIQGNLSTVLIRRGGEKPVLAIIKIIQIVNAVPYPWRTRAEVEESQWEKDNPSVVSHGRGLG